MSHDYGVDDIIHDGAFYDALNTDVGDLRFYATCCQSFGNPVLELCCGTGRLTVPLAEMGIQMTGLDISESMLTRARAKADRAGVQLTWVKGDIRHFSLDRLFRLIFIPFNSLQNTYSFHDVARIFARVKRHLVPGGRLVFDIFNPDIELMVRRSTTPVEHYRGTLDDGRPVVVSESCHYDADGQVNRVTWCWQGEEGAMQTAKLDMRCFFPLEMDALLYYAGFEVLRKLGDFDETPFTAQSPKQIYICSVVE